MNEEIWKKAVAFHGHECPGLAIGTRACEAAMEKLRITAAKDEEIVCVTENDACGVDAIQAILGCTIGKGNLIYRDTGKQAFTFFNRNTGESIRIYFKAQNNEGLEKDQWKKQILEMPTDELFDFSKPKINLPEKARIFKTKACYICGERAAEHKMRIQDGKQVCLDCFKPYYRGWSG